MAPVSGGGGQGAGLPDGGGGGTDVITGAESGADGRLTFAAATRPGEWPDWARVAEGNEPEEPGDDAAIADCAAIRDCAAGDCTVDCAAETAG
jgi:hypothetical protein